MLFCLKAVIQWSSPKQGFLLSCIGCVKYSVYLEPTRSSVGLTGVSLLAQGSVFDTRKHQVSSQIGCLTGTRTQQRSECHRAGGSAGSKATGGNKQPLKFPHGVIRLNPSVVGEWKAQVRSKTYTNREDSGSGHLGLYGSNGQSEIVASLLKSKDSNSLCQHSVGKGGTLVSSC